MSASSSVMFVEMDESCEVRERTDVGGRRGVFATRDISPGEVVVAEAPLVPYLSGKSETEDHVHIFLAKEVLRHQDRDSVLEQMKPLYPQSMDDLEESVYKRAKKVHADSVDTLVDYQNEPKLEEKDVFCLLLKICFNAFEGGICIKKSMFNHRCLPNCMTFSPGERVNGQTGQKTYSKMSEVVATRAIKQGEEIFISYLYPLEQSFAARSKKFEAQHFCNLNESPWPVEMESFLFEDQEGFDREAVVEDMGYIEQSCEKLDEMLEGNQVSHKFALKQLKSEKVEAEQILHPHHLVMCRINNMIVRSAHEIASSQKNPNPALIALILRCRSIALVPSSAASDLTCSSELQDSLGKALGSDHCDLARILCDIQVALEFMMQAAPELLYASFPEK